MDSQKIIDAIENGKLADASEMINDVLLSRIGSALEERKTDIGETLVRGVDVQEEEDSEYDRFFRAALKKFGVSSPADFDSEEEKKKFFNYVDKNFKGKNESVELDEEAKTLMQLADEHAEYHYDYDQGWGDRLKSAPAKMEKIEKEITKRFGSKVTEMVKERSRTSTYEAEYAGPGESAKARKEIEDIDKKLSKLKESVELKEASVKITPKEEKELKDAIQMYRTMKDIKRRNVADDMADLLQDLKSGDMESAKVSFKVLDKNAQEMVPDSVYEKLFT